MHPRRTPETNLDVALRKRMVIPMVKEGKTWTSVLHPLLKQDQATMTAIDLFLGDFDGKKTAPRHRKCAYFLTLLKDEHGMATFKPKDFASRVNLTPSWVMRTIRELENHNYVKVISRDGDDARVMVAPIRDVSHNDENGVEDE